MDVERRQHERQKLYSPEYFDMGAENGGMIVDISEDGLGFQAVGRVEKGAEIAVSFSLGAGYRISARARIAWVGANGNSGGTTFTRLPADSRSIIREWVTKTAEAGAAREAAATVQAEITAPESRAEEAPLIIEHARAPLSPMKPAHEPFGAQPEIPPIAIPQPVIPQPDLQQGVEPDVAVAAEPVIQEGLQQNLAPRVSQNVQHDVPSTAGMPPEVPAATPKLSAQTRENSQRERQTVAAPQRTESPRPSFSPRNTSELFSRSPWISGESLPEEKRRHKGLIAVIVIFLIVAASVASVPYIRSHRQQIGERIEGVGRSLAGQPAQNAPAPRQTSRQPAQQPSRQTSQPSLQTAAPHSSTPSSSGSAIPGNPPSASTAALAPQLHPDAPATIAGSGATTHSSPVTSPLSATASAAGSTGLLTGPGQTEFHQAQKYLNGAAGVAADPAEAAELFWRSLEKGNTAAAIPLADLYLQGKGVARSCLQARILLTAASNKGDAEAIQKLRDLPENCEE